MTTTKKLPKDQDVYVALPLSDDNHDVEEDETTAERYPWFCNHLIYRSFLIPVLWFAILIALVLVAFWVEVHSASSCRHHHHHHHHHHERYPTKLAGGGRDWLVNTVTGTIHAKHDPSLVLGVDTDYPLVLIHKDSPNALQFGSPPKDEGTLVPFHDWRAGVSVLTGDKQHSNDAYPVKEALLIPHLNRNEEALVSLQENSVIVLEDTYRSREIHKMVLDVDISDCWNLVEGTAVNFVESRKSLSGGRDFTWNDDGSIATKLNPNLVLGMAAPKLILVSEESSNKIVLEHAQALANGKTVPMTLANGGGAVSKRYKDAHECGYEPWHYIESQVVDRLDEEYPHSVVNVRYDGNYIFVDGNDDLVLDVAFWDMKPGTSINFVGGDHDKTTKCGDKGMSHLRSSTMERSKDSSESSASSNIGSSDSSSSSNISGSGKNSFDVVSGDEDEIVLTSGDIPVKEERR